MISVVIATYNGERYLKEQVDSILAQTLMPDEIVFSDDCSSDGTWAIIQEYCCLYPTLFHAYKNTTRIGPHENFKKAFKLSKGDFIAPSDQDDIWFPDKLKITFNALIKSGKDLCFMQDRIHFEDGTIEDSHRIVTPVFDTLFRTYLWGHTCVFKRDLLKAYEIAPYYAFDSTLALWCSCHNSALSIDQVGSIWRRHDGVSTSAFSNNSSLRIEQISTRAKTIKALWLLLRGYKSEPIRVVAEQERLILEASYQETKNPQLFLYAEMMKGLSSQSVRSMLSAGMKSGLAILNSENKQSVLYLFKRFFWAFRYPFVWWYDLRDQRRIGNTEPGYLSR